MENERPSRGERIFVAVIGVIFATQFVLALRYPSDPRLFPMLIAGAGALLAVAMECGVGLGGSAAAMHVPSARARLFLALVVPPFFAVMLWGLGFWIATLVAIPGIAWLLGYRRPLVIVLVTLAMAAAIGIVFPLVNVALPTGAIFPRHHY